MPAVHSSGYAPRLRQAEYGGTPIGFVIQIEGGPTIYHTGDTDAFYDMKDRIGDRFKVDVMLACIGGHFTMDPEGAALAATYVNPRYRAHALRDVPNLNGTPEDLAKALKAHHSKSKLLQMQVGVPVTL